MRAKTNKLIGNKIKGNKITINIAFKTIDLVQERSELYFYVFFLGFLIFI